MDVPRYTAVLGQDINQPAEIPRVFPSAKKRNIVYKHKSLDQPTDLKHRLSPGFCCKCLDLFCSDCTLGGLVLQCLDHRFAYNVGFEGLFGHSSEEPKPVPEECVELRGNKATHCNWQRELPTRVVHEARAYEDAS